MQAVPLVVAYLLGSIPFGLLVGFLAGKDVRTEGSGNIGFTNVLRVCGAAWGVPVLALDILKGFAPVFWVAPWLVSGPERQLIQVIAGVAAIVGHNFPVWLKFKGGKGVATSAGVVLALMWQPFLVALATWLVLVGISRYVSLGSIGASMALVVAYFCFTSHPFSKGEIPLTGMALLLCVLVIVRHKANIQRLLDGTESKIGAKAKDDAGDEARADADDKEDERDDEANT